MSEQQQVTTTTDSASSSSPSPPSERLSPLSASAELATGLISMIISLKTASYVFQLAAKGVLPAEWAVAAFVAIAAPTSVVGSGLVKRLKSAGAALMKGKE